MNWSKFKGKLLSSLKIVTAAVPTLALCVSVAVFWSTQNEKQHELKYSQADQISVWLKVDGDNASQGTAIISNSSSNPIYDVVVSPGLLHQNVPYTKGDSLAVPLPPIPPGKWSTRLPLEGVRGMSAEPWVAIAFTDVRGQSWVRKTTGDLQTINQSPREFMQLTLPVNYAPINEYKDS